MKTFKNGDVLLSKDEYMRLMASDGKRESWEFVNYLTRHIRFYYDLKELIYKHLPTISVSSSPMQEYYEEYRISKKEYQLFSSLMKCINNFEPDRPVD